MIRLHKVSIKNRLYSISICTADKVASLAEELAVGLKVVFILFILISISIGQICVLVFITRNVVLVAQGSD